MKRELDLPRRLIGFQLSPNNEAYDLERVLGIDFPNKPSKIVLNNGRNRLVYGIYGFLFREFRPGKIEAPTGFKAHVEGFYQHRTNTVFVENDVPILIHHENIHAYTNFTNPAIRKYLLVSIDRGIFEPEKFSVLRSFQEGIAEYGSIQTSLGVNVPEQRKAASERNNALTGSNLVDDRLIISPRVIKQVFKVYGQEIKQAEEEKERGVLPNEIGYPVNYSLGYYFAFLATHEMRNSGLSTGEGMTL